MEDADSWEWEVPDDSETGAVRHKILRWKRLEVGVIFRWIEGVEMDIAGLQIREDQEGVLQESDLRELCHKLSVHHSLLR